MSELGKEEPFSRETSRGLPKVSEFTTRSITENYTRRESWGSHLEEVKSRLLIENPHLVRFIEGQVSKYPEELHNHMFEIFAATIAILEHQTMSDKLSKQFDLEPPR